MPYIVGLRAKQQGVNFLESFWGFSRFSNSIQPTFSTDPYPNFISFIISITVYHHHHHHHHQSVLLKGRFFTVNSGNKVAVQPKGTSSTANSGTKVAVLLRMNRCGSFSLLSAPHSFFSIITDLKRSEKIPGR